MIPYFQIKANNIRIHEIYVEFLMMIQMNRNYAMQKEGKCKKFKASKWCCPGSNWGPLVCKTNVITDYTTAP